MAERVRKIVASDFRRMKREGKKIVIITAYDYPSALLADRAGVDAILVGDSLGMVILGYRSTTPVTVEEMVHHCKAVARGTERAYTIGDLPFMSYNESRSKAIRNAGRIVKEGGVDAVKVEGGVKVRDKVEAIIDAGIPVMGHIGLNPQTARLWSGYKVQGRTADSAKRILEDAVALEAAGVFAIVLELTTVEVATLVTEKLSVPVIGIGSGPTCDGQVLVFHDMMGLYEKSPRFTKKYADLSRQISEGIAAYREEVEAGLFPFEEHCFHMEEEEKRNLEIAVGRPHGSRSHGG